MIQRYRPLKAAELAAVEAKLQSAVVAWSADWLQSPAQVRAVLPLAPEFAATDDGCWLKAAAGVQLQVTIGACAALTQAMLPQHSSAGRGPVLEALQRSALAALLATIAGSETAVVEADGPAREMLVRGVGTAHATIALGDTVMTLLIARELIDHLTGVTAPPRTPATTPLTSRWQAIRNARVRLEVQLPEAELTVEELRRIRARDVIRFDHPIARAVSVRVPQGPGVGACYLGCIAGRKAATLVKSEEQS